MKRIKICGRYLEQCLKTYVIKEKKSQISDLGFHFKKLETLQKQFSGERIDFSTHSTIAGYTHTNKT